MKIQIYKDHAMYCVAITNGLGIYQPLLNERGKIDWFYTKKGAEQIVKALLANPNYSAQ